MKARTIGWFILGFVASFFFIGMLLALIASYGIKGIYIFIVFIAMIILICLGSYLVFK